MTPLPISWTAVWALARVEATALHRSWLVRLWAGFALLTSVLPILLVADAESPVSETIAGWLAIYFAPSAIVAGVLGAGAIAQEVEVAADSILTRAVTRLDYVAAKLLSRVGAVLLVHSAATLPLLLLARRFGLDDASTSGLIMAAAVTGALLAFVTTLGLALGTVLRNMLVAAVAIMVLFALEGAIFHLLELPYLSAGAVLSDLAPIIRRDTGGWEQARILLAFALGSAGLASAAAAVFDRREL